MTLVALLALTTQAWATDETPLTTITPTGDGTYSETTAGAVTVTPAGSFFYSGSSYGWRWDSYGSLTVTANEGYTITRCVFIQQGKNQSVTISEAPFALNFEEYLCLENTSMDGVTSIEVYGTYEPPIEVAWNAETKTGTFNMPGSDVVLTPRYAAATLYQNDGETEKQAYETLKEAIANVQDGDVIKLDWDVTLTENLKTPTIQNGAKFTVDFNGHTLDCGIYGISLTNSGDQLTFTDNSGEKDPGGLINTSLGAADNAKYIFDAGRYTLANNATAAEINECCESFDTHELAEGKEFVDLEGGAAANDGFTVRVDWKTYELAIGAGRFDTFFAAQNVVLVEGEDISFYTISSINDERTEAYVTLITSEVIPAGTPILVYNGGQAKQTVKLMVGPTNVINTLLPTHAPEFVGTAVDKTFDDDMMAAADYYALSGGKLFVPVYDAGTIGKNQCWLEFLKSAGDTGGNAPARGITLVFEESETTEITTTDVTDETDGAWYDLSGRKLDGEPTTKGVYIKDGKKVVVR